MGNTILILAARNQLSTDNYNSQMTPIHGKPAISWICDLYSLDQNVFIVINAKNMLLQNYIKTFYPNINCVLVNQDEMYKKHGQNSVLTSLFEGVSKLPHDTSSLKVVLGDTYCKNDDYEFSDYILTSDGLGASEKWCLADTDHNGFLNKLYDKEKKIDVYKLTL